MMQHGCLGIYNSGATAEGGVVLTVSFFCCCWEFLEESMVKFVNKRHPYTSTTIMRLP